MNVLQNTFLALFISLSSYHISAGELRTEIDNNSKALFSKIQENKEFYMNNKDQLEALVMESIAPYFHFNYMSRFVAARYWKKMDKAQQEIYQNLFKKLLISTYSGLVLDYRYEELTIEEERPARKKNRYNITMYINNQGERIRIDYEIAKTKKGNQVINFKVEGVSLLINYRKSFGDIFAKKGTEALLNFLQKTIQEKATSTAT